MTGAIWDTGLSVSEGGLTGGTATTVGEWWVVWTSGSRLTRRSTGPSSSVCTRVLVPGGEPAGVYFLKIVHVSFAY